MGLLTQAIQENSAHCLQKEAGKWDRRLLDLIKKVESSGKTKLPTGSTGNQLYNHAKYGPLGALQHSYERGDTPQIIKDRARFLDFVRGLLGSYPTEFKSLYKPQTPARAKLRDIIEAETQTSPTTLASVYPGMKSDILAHDAKQGWHYIKPSFNLPPGKLPPTLQVAMPAHVIPAGLEVTPSTSTKKISYPFLPNSSEYPNLPSIESSKHIFRGMTNAAAESNLSNADDQAMLFSSGYPDIASGYANHRIGGSPETNPNALLWSIRTSKIPYKHVFTPHVMSVNEVERGAAQDSRHVGQWWDSRPKYETITPSNQLRKALQSSRAYIPEINVDANRVILTPVRTKATPEIAVPARNDILNRDYGDALRDYALKGVSENVSTFPPSFVNSELKNATRRDAINLRDFVNDSHKTKPIVTAPPTGLWDSFKHYLPSFGS